MIRPKGETNLWLVLCVIVGAVTAAAWQSRTWLGVLAGAALAAVAGGAIGAAVARYRAHPDRAAHLADMNGRYPLRSGRRRGYRPWS